MKLSQLCGVHSGYTARSRLEPANEGGLPVLQLRDITEGAEFAVPELQRYDLPAAERFHVVDGDVIFRSRGEPSTAAVVRSVDVDPIVVIAPLMILRPDTKKLLPDYLAWFINRPETQRTLSSEAQGTGLRMISVATLEKLEIAVPDLATQEQIAELDALGRLEARLLQQLAESRTRLLTTLLGEAAERAANQEAHA